MGTIQIDGSTPKITVGNATAEDATILFDGNAQDFYIALDDSADDLLIGLGSTVGTTPIIAIDENKLSTFSGAITVGVDDTGHDVKFFGATAGSFALWDESADALLLTDSTPIQIGDAQDLTLYHDGSNSYITNKTGALKVATETSGIAITLGHTTSEVTVADNFTVTGTITLADGSLALADLDIDGGTDIGAAIVDADLFIVDDGAGGTNRKVAASRLKTYAGGSGKILQVVSVEKTDTFSTTSTSFVDITDLDVDITPAATSSKILVMYTTAIGCATAVNGAYLRLMRDSTVIFEGTQTDTLILGVRHARVTAIDELYPCSGSMVDSPSSTSAINYGLELRSQLGNATTANIAGSGGEILVSSSIVAIEIGA